jgi:hypothetical protein
MQSVFLERDERKVPVFRPRDRCAALLVASSFLGGALDTRPVAAQTAAQTDPSMATETPSPGVAAAPVRVEPAACVPDCRGGFVCVSGACVSACNPSCPAGQHCTLTRSCDPDVAPAPANLPPPASADIVLVPPSTARPEEPRGADTHFAAYANVLGFLQFGVVPAIEVGGRNFGLSARLRVMQTGVLSHLLLADPTDDEVFASGLGFGGHARYYSGRGGNMRAFYFGGGLEYLSTRIEDTTSDREAYVTSLLVPQIELGYRWVWGNFLLDVGGAAGYSLITSAETEDQSDGEHRRLYDNESENTFYAMAVLNLGFCL